MATLIYEVGEKELGSLREEMILRLRKKVVLELSWIKRLFGRVAGYTYRKMGH